MGKVKVSVEFLGEFMSMCRYFGIVVNGSYECIEDKTVGLLISGNSIPDGEVSCYIHTDSENGTAKIEFKLIDHAPPLKPT